MSEDCRILSMIACSWTSLRGDDFSEEAMNLSSGRLRISSDMNPWELNLDVGFVNQGKPPTARYQPQNVLNLKTGVDSTKNPL